MPVQKTDKIWHNGKWINWDDAKIHVLSHVVSYGTSLFEGIATTRNKALRSSDCTNTCSG